MNTLVDFIHGVSVGIEFHRDVGVYCVLNLFIVRIMFVSDEVMEELERDE